jgi:hypothetical protein
MPQAGTALLRINPFIVGGLVSSRLDALRYALRTNGCPLKREMKG